MTMWNPRLEDGAPRYVAIADAIARDVAGGVLDEGTRLPTHRELAEALQVTVGTVTRGYSEARRRGLTIGEVGRGTFVRSRTDLEDFGWRDAARTSVGSGAIDMSLACPWVPPDGEEGRALAETLTQVAASGSLDELMCYHATSALSRHHAVAAEWLGSLGLPVSPEQIVVTNGAQHAMVVCLAMTLRPGDTLMTAELTYPGLKAVAQMLGINVRGVAMDDEGIVPEALDAMCTASPAHGLYCIPTIQNPTCATMSEERRASIAEVARRHGLIVVEDEIHVAMEDERIPAIATFAPERTLHITKLSKWASFGLRIGFVAAPERAVERIRSGVRSSLWMPAPLMTEVAIRWITDGTGERLARRKLEELEARHEIVREVLECHSIDAHPRSLHFWLHLPEPLRSDECVAQARQRGVLIAGAEAFAVGRDVPHAVRVSIAAVPHRKDVRRGLNVLAEVLDGVCDPCVEIL